MFRSRSSIPASSITRNGPVFSWGVVIFKCGSIFGGIWGYLVPTKFKRRFLITKNIFGALRAPKLVCGMLFCLYPREHNYGTGTFWKHWNEPTRMGRLLLLTLLKPSRMRTVRLRSSTPILPRVFRSIFRGTSWNCSPRSKQTRALNLSYLFAYHLLFEIRSRVSIVRNHPSRRSKADSGGVPQNRHLWGGY